MAHEVAPAPTPPERRNPRPGALLRALLLVALGIAIALLFDVVRRAGDEDDPPTRAGTTAQRGEPATGAQRESRRAGDRQARASRRETRRSRRRRSSATAPRLSAALARGKSAAPTPGSGGSGGSGGSSAPPPRRPRPTGERESDRPPTRDTPPPSTPPRSTPPPASTPSPPPAETPAPPPEPKPAVQITVQCPDRQICGDEPVVDAGVLCPTGIVCSNPRAALMGRPFLLARPHVP